MNEEELQKMIMKRVRVMYLLRRLTQFPQGEILGLSFLALLSLLFISFQHIIANMISLHDVKAMPGFFESAFLGTKLVVKLIIITGAVMLLKACWNISSWCGRRIYNASSYIISSFSFSKPTA